MLEVGDKVPEFDLPDQEGERLRSSDLEGKRVVLCFYPGDFTSVCGDQLALYESVKEDFSEAGVEVIGISVDSATCHKAFAEKLGLTMRLLSDFHPKGEFSMACGTWSPDFGCSTRSLILMEPDGTASWIYHSEPLDVPGANLIFDALES